MSKSAEDDSKEEDDVDVQPAEKFFGNMSVLVMQPHLGHQPVSFVWVVQPLTGCGAGQDVVLTNVCGAGGDDHHDRSVPFTSVNQC